MSAFATGGALGIAATAITTVISAYQEMKNKAEEAAKVRFDSQAKSLKEISERADNATESYKKLAKQVDDFKKSLLGITMADISQAMTTKEIEQETKRLNGDKVGAAEKGVEIAREEAKKVVEPAKAAAEEAANAYKTASRAHDNQTKVVNQVTQRIQQYKDKIESIISEHKEDWENGTDLASKTWSAEWDSHVHGKESLNPDDYHEHWRKDIMRYQLMLADAEAELVKANDREHELKNEALTVYNKKLAADKEAARAEEQAKLVVLRAETKLKEAKDEQLKAEQEKAKKAKQESKEKKHKDITSMRKDASLDQQVGNSEIEVLNAQNQTKILEAKAGGMDQIGLAKM